MMTMNLKPTVLKVEHWDHKFGPLTYDVLHEIMCRFVENQFAQKGLIHPTWALSTRGFITWVETIWSNGTGKQVAAHAMRSFMRKTDVDSYSFACEAYTTSSFAIPEAERERALDFAQKHGVASLPEEFRDDVVFITSFSKNGPHLISDYKVTIRKRGGLNFLGPRVDQEKQLDEFQGIMWNLLRDPE
jgi:hypothetical protein